MVIMRLQLPSTTVVMEEDMVVATSTEDTEAMDDTMEDITAPGSILCGDSLMRFKNKTVPILPFQLPKKLYKPLIY